MVPGAGWRSLFLVGGVLPLAAAAVAYAVFAAAEPDAPSRAATPRPRLAELFTGVRAVRSLAMLTVFFFGYVTTSIIVNWLPTVLDHGGGSPALISATFAGVNVGGAVGIFALGLYSTRFPSRYNLALTWGIAGVAALACAMVASLDHVAVVAIFAATVATGSQALSVALANRLHPGSNLESATVGFMISGGRIGQFSALGLSGPLLAAGVPERGLFAFAGGSACIAAAVALVLARSFAPGSATLQPRGEQGATRK